MKKAWRGFTGTKWVDEVNLRQFIQDNYTTYEGDASFLEAPTEATDKLWGMLKELQKQERRRIGYGNGNCFQYDGLWPCLYRRGN